MTAPPEKPDNKDHEKHLQLGVDLDTIDEDPIEVTDKAEQNDIWADATTVEEFKRDIEILANTEV